MPSTIAAAAPKKIAPSRWWSSSRPKTGAASAKPVSRPE